MAVKQRVSLSGEKVAFYTWEGCKLLVEGTPEVVYVSSETLMVPYANTHEALEARRRAARTAGSGVGGGGTAPQGPRTVIVGPTDVGKSTLAKVLLNYAARLGWEPTFVDLDIGQGTVTLPGCLAAAPIEAPADAEEGLAGVADVPLVYFFGHTSPSERPELYKQLLGRLVGLLDSRAETAGPLVRSSGWVVNTMGWVEGLGYQMLLHTIDATKADVVIVLGQERLYSQLNNAFKARKGVEVVKLPASGGAVPRNPEYRRKARMQRVREYFYGPRNDLSPHSSSARFDELQVWRVGGAPRAPSSALPIGAAAQQDPLKLSQVQWAPDMMHSVLAVSHAESKDDILRTNVAGFIYVTDVDMIKNRVTFMAPCPGPLPSRMLLTGSIKWLEQ